MNQFNNLEGKVALVTGAIGQLGNKFIHSLAENGASVCITDKNLSLCKKKIKFLPSNKFLNHTAISLDVTSEKAANDAVKFVKKTYDKIDILVNNAGVAVFSDFSDRKKRDFMKIFEINIYGAFNCIQKFSKLMIEKKTKGSIINIGSIYGSVSSDPSIYSKGDRKVSEIYAITKAGIIQMTKYFAIHLAKNNIRVNCISPGGVSNLQSKKFIKNYSRKVPFNRMANVEEITGSLIFLSNNSMSSYLTGQNIIVDGGFTSW